MLRGGRTDDNVLQYRGKVQGAVEGTLEVAGGESKGSRASVVQIDGAGRGGLVDPGVACWVGICGELGAREERGMSARQFAVMSSPEDLRSLAFDRSFQCPVHSGRKWYTLLGLG